MSLINSFANDRHERRIKEIAQEVGYEDVYYFSRLFKKTVGSAPRTFRRTL